MVGLFKQDLKNNITSWQDVVDGGELSSPHSLKERQAINGC